MYEEADMVRGRWEMRGQEGCEEGEEGEGGSSGAGRGRGEKNGGREREGRKIVGKGREGKNFARAAPREGREGDKGREGERPTPCPPLMYGSEDETYSLLFCLAPKSYWIFLCHVYTLDAGLTFIRSYRETGPLGRTMDSNLQSKDVHLKTRAQLAPYTTKAVCVMIVSMQLENDPRKRGKILISHLCDFCYFVQLSE